MRPVCLHMISTLFTTLLQNLIKDKLVDFIEIISKEKVLFISH